MERTAASLPSPGVKRRAPDLQQLQRRATTLGAPSAASPRAAGSRAAATMTPPRRRPAGGSALGLALAPPRASPPPLVAPGSTARSPTALPAGNGTPPRDRPPPLTSLSAPVLPTGPPVAQLRAALQLQPEPEPEPELAPELRPMLVLGPEPEPEPEPELEPGAAVRARAAAAAQRAAARNKVRAAVRLQGRNRFWSAASEDAGTPAAAGDAGAARARAAVAAAAAAQRGSGAAGDDDLLCAEMLDDAGDVHASDEEADGVQLTLVSAVIRKPVLTGDHVEYEVVTTYSTDHASTSSATVMRRFSKFETLRKLIVKEFPDLPKLPKKGWKLHGGVNSAALADFDEQERAALTGAKKAPTDPRMEGLNLFLKAVVQQEPAHQNETVQQFLGVSELDRMARKEVERRDSSRQLWGKASSSILTGVRLGGHASAPQLGTTAEDLAQQAAEQNVFEQSAATGGSYVPREQRNKKQHAMHSVAKKAARATEIAGMQGRNAPPTVPRRVLDVLGVDDTTLDSDRTFRRGVSEKLPKVPQLAEEVEEGKVKVVNLWNVYVKLEREVEGHVWTFVVFAVYWVLLMMTFFDGPTSSWGLAQSEAISDLLFDEEFSDSNYKKNWFEVMTQGELFTWAEGPLTQAFFDPDSEESISLLGGTTHLVGQVQFRQVRSDRNSSAAGSECPTEFGGWRMTADNATAGVEADLVAEPLVSDGDCSGLFHGAKGQWSWQDVVGDESAAPPSPHNWSWAGHFRRHEAPLEGSRSFVRHSAGGLNPFTGASWNYGTGSYSVLLPRDYAGFTSTIQRLKEDFIDQHTRAVAITMVLYNGNSFRYDLQGPDDATDVVNSDQLLYVQAIVEIDPGGHYEKYIRILAIRPMRDDAVWKGLMWGKLGVPRILWRVDEYGQAWSVLALILFLVEVRKLVWVDGPRVFLIVSASSAWNWFEVFVWVMLIWTLFAAHGLQLSSDSTLEQVAVATGEPSDDASHVLIDRAAELREAQIYYRRLTAWTLFFSTLKVMKFMNLSERLSFLWRVLGHAKVELLAFLGIFMVLLLSFGLLATTLMGYHVRELHNVPTALLSLLRLTVGTFDLQYDDWKDADPIGAPIFLLLFIFLLILVAANIFIAILTDAYSKKKAQINKYTAFKKILRREGTLLKSGSFAGLLKQIYRTLFPHWRLQVPHNLWPRPDDVQVEPVFKVHPFAEGGGADIVTLHFHHESMLGNRERDETQKPNLRSSLLARRQVGIHHSRLSAPGGAEEGEEESEGPPAENALRGERAEKAVYLQLAQDTHTEGLAILITKLRPGEMVELKGRGKSFRSKIKLEMIEVFKRESTRDRAGEPEHSIDYFANLKVVDVKSWESFTRHQATQLLLDTSTWTAKQDSIILNNLRLKREQAQRALQGDGQSPRDAMAPRAVSVSKLAEQLERTADEVRSRQRFIKQCTDAGSKPPVLMAETLHWSRSLSLKLLLRAWRDPALPHYSIMGWVMPRLHKIFLTKSGVERDVDDYLHGRVEELKRKNNMRDLEHVRRAFTKESIQLDEFSNHMQLFLYATRRRRLAYLHQTYSNPMYQRWLMLYLQTEYKEEITSVRQKKRRDIPKPPS